MKIVSVGPDELSEYDLKELPQLERQCSYKVEEFVYWYEIHPYSGDGCAVYRDSNQDWHVIGLGHCSCYGPLEDLKSVPMTKEQVLGLLSDGKHYYHFDEEGEERPYEELIDYLKNTVKEEEQWTLKK